MVDDKKEKHSTFNKLVIKDVVKKVTTPTVVIKNADLSPDRSRFFKETWKEDKRQLFFK